MSAILQNTPHLWSTYVNEAHQRALQPNGPALPAQWNATSRDYPLDTCLHQIIEKQVADTPEATALIFEERSLTYREVNEQANQLAHFLQRNGVGPDVIVGVYMERSLDLIITLLGIFKAGGAYCPLDPTVPAERIAWLFADIQPAIVLTQSSLLPLLPAQTTRVLCLNTDTLSWQSEPTSNPQSAVTAEHLAYVIYTSGSTGQPKGVMISHRNICNSLLWMQDTFQLTPNDSMIQKTPIVFDASLWELFWPLMTGAKIIIARPEGHKDSTYLLSLALKHHVTVLFFVPSMLQAFVEEPGLVKCENLRLLLAGGEALSYELKERFQARHHAAFYNLYGPTEAAIEVTYWSCQQTNTSSIVPIGKPIANTQLYLLDPYGSPVLIGQPGELYIGGENLARGYLNRADLTAERFIPNPFSRKAGARLYKTGDIARYGEDGRLEYVGRTDQQIKLRGNRIELGEIEAALRSHPSVQMSAVVLREQLETEKYLAAYLMLCMGQRLTVSELRSYLHKHLPDYMIPALFIFLDSMPLTISGKIDRLALPAPEQNALRSQAEVVTPQTPLQILLAEIWAEVLHLPQVSIYDNFFDLGGHSLLLTQVVSRIRQKLRQEIPLRTFFEAPTVAALAEKLASITPGTVQSHLATLVPSKRDDILPLSFGQERLWFLDQFAPQNTVCNVPLMRRITGQLAVEIFEQSLAAVVQRHESLRMTFRVQNGQTTQIIAPSRVTFVPLIDLRQFTDAEQAIRVRFLAQEEANRPFDLASGPLLRAQLLCLSEQEHILLFTIHHIITDGWSMNVLTRELSAYYNALLHGKDVALPDLPIQYTDYSIWQRSWWETDALRAQLDYWQQQLKEAPTLLDLPTDRPRPAVQTYAGARKALQISKQLSQDLESLSQQEDVTLFMTLLAVFQVLLLRYSGQQDIVVGAPIANRTRRELENLAGLFINTIVLRTDLSGNPTFRQLLMRVREVALQAYAHQDLPFEKLVESLQIERSLSYAPLFQVFFTLQNGPPEHFDLEGLSLSSLDVEQTTAKFDLSLTLTSNAVNGLLTEVEYNTDLFEEATIVRLLGHWQLLLEAVVRDVEQPIEQLPLLTANELQQMHVQWNTTNRPDHPVGCMHEFIEAQVERSPQAIAVCFEGKQLTYRELNTRANQLAHVLQQSGVGPDVLVGVYMERSLELVIALLGILKAGGAYVPFDPSYPLERLTFMFNDAQPALIITQKHLHSTCPSSSALLCLDSGWQQFEHQPVSNPETSLVPEHLAYMIYTSGSTGKPKGVMNTHKGICNNLQWKEEAYQLTDQDRVLHKTPLSFDVSVWEIFLPLMVGACMVVARPDGHKDSAYLVSLIKASQVTLMEVVPSLLQVLVEEPGFMKCQSLRLVVCGGDTLSYELQQRFFACHPATLYNTYGPTEAAIDATYWVCERDSKRLNIPIGLPIANTQLYILDTYRNPVPIGVSGEIYIGGMSLARGYFNRPDLTAERFLPDAFGAIPGQLLYRTGDLACYRADGEVEYLGRIDQQVKLRGFRIELGEIETVLLSHPEVQETVVLLKEERAQKFLIAYVVRQAETILTKETLRLYLGKHLPTYMVPNTFIFLDTLPLSANGKVDRRALALKTVARMPEQEERVAPRNSVEHKLASIWMELLQLGQIGITDNFFELGGHSLLAMQLLNRIKQHFGVAFPLATLFQVPTIAQEAALLQQEEMQEALIPSPIVTIQSAGNKRPFFCVHPVSGEAYSYLKLAQHLHHNRPFYGIQARGLHHNQVAHTNVEEMAAYYMHELQTIQPEGPYLLGGYSFGGIVAFEMAQQLQAQGSSVALLAIIDAIPNKQEKDKLVSWLPSSSKRKAIYGSKGGIGFLKLLNSYTNIMLSALQGQLSQKRPKNQFRYLLGLLLKIMLMPQDTNAAQVRRFLRVVKANESGRRQYQPRLYQGHIALFCREDYGYDPAAIWTAFSSEPIKTYTVAGDHLTMLDEPHVTSLATYLQQSIDQADPN